jgi:hypothetical protein
MFDVDRPRVHGTPQPSGFTSSLGIYDLATIVSMYSSRMMQITLIRLHFPHSYRTATHPYEYKQVTPETVVSNAK